jgi:hypothetical protein
LTKDINELVKNTDALGKSQSAKTNRGIDHLELDMKINISDKEKYQNERIKEKIAGLISPMYLLKADISYDNRTWETSGRKGLKNWQVESFVTEENEALKLYVKIEYIEASN